KGTEVLRIDPATNTVVATVHLSEELRWLAVGNGSAWVAGNSTVWRVDAASNEVTGTFPTSAQVNALAFGEGSLWVAEDNQSVVRVDPRSLALRSRVPLKSEPMGLAIVQHAVWITTPGTSREPGAQVLQLDAARDRLVGEAFSLGGGSYSKATGVHSDLTSFAAAGNVLWLGDDRGDLTRLDLVMCPS